MQKCITFTTIALLMFSSSQAGDLPVGKMISVNPSKQSDTDLPDRWIVIGKYALDLKTMQKCQSIDYYQNGTAMCNASDGGNRINGLYFWAKKDQQKPFQLVVDCRLRKLNGVLSVPETNEEFLIDRVCPAFCQDQNIDKRLSHADTARKNLLNLDPRWILLIITPDYNGHSKSYYYDMRTVQKCSSPFPSSTRVNCYRQDANFSRVTNGYQVWVKAVEEEATDESNYYKRKNNHVLVTDYHWIVDCGRKVQDLLPESIDEA